MEHSHLYKLMEEFSAIEQTDFKAFGEMYARVNNCTVFLWCYLVVNVHLAITFYEVDLLPLNSVIGTGFCAIF